jgi:hypothetical protein
MTKRPTQLAACIPEFVGFGVLTAVDMKSAILLDVTASSSVEVRLCFGGIYCPQSSGSNCLIRITLTPKKVAVRSSESSVKFTNCIYLLTVS